MISELIDKMIEYETGCPKRINHFLKVYSFAKLIAENENLSEDIMQIVSIASIVHDIGIKISLEKYNSTSGKYQEKEGPAVAQKMLAELGFKQDLIDRVSFLIANHHSYDNIDGIDYQILIEADFLVNIFEDGLSKEQAEHIEERYFKTAYGKKLLETMYLN
jgi:HD superfamily phosphodiesterase